MELIDKSAIEYRRKQIYERQAIETMSHHHHHRIAAGGCGGGGRIHTTAMSKDPIYQEMKIRAQLAVLRDVMKEYKGRTIDNIINNLEARLNYYEKAKNH